MTSVRPTRPSFVHTASSATPENGMTDSNKGAPQGASKESFEALRQRHDQLQRGRSRFELLQEQAIAEVNACTEEAKKLGVNSLEELVALNQQHKEDDEKALATWQREVAAEAELQATIEKNLEAVEQDGP